MTLCCAGSAPQNPSLQRQISMLRLEAVSLVSGIRAGLLRIAESRLQGTARSATAFCPVGSNQKDGLIQQKSQRIMYTLYQVTSGDLTRNHHVPKKSSTHSYLTDSCCVAMDLLWWIKYINNRIEHIRNVHGNIFLKTWPDLSPSFLVVQRITAGGARYQRAALPPLEALHQLLPSATQHTWQRSFPPVGLCAAPFDVFLSVIYGFILKMNSKLIMDQQRSSRRTIKY